MRSWTPREVFQWRPTGLLDGGIHANDDAGSLRTPLGGLAAQVLANNWLSEARPTACSVSVAMVSPAAPDITFGAAGDVRVAPGTPVGTYPVIRRINETSSPSKSDEATVILDLSRRSR